MSTDIKEIGGKTLRSSDIPTRGTLGEKMPRGGNTLGLRNRKLGISDGVPKTMGGVIGRRFSQEPWQRRLRAKAWGLLE